MNGDILLQLIAALGGTVGIGALIDRFVHRRALRAKVEAEADRAEIDGAERIAQIAVESLLGPLETQVKQLTVQMTDNRTQYREEMRELSSALRDSRAEVAELTGSLAASRRELAASRREISALTSYVGQLIDALRRHQVPVPPWPDGVGGDPE